MAAHRWREACATSDLPMITDAMLRRGYSEQRIDKFWGGNLLRVFRQVTQNKG